MISVILSPCTSWWSRESILLVGKCGLVHLSTAFPSWGFKVVPGLRKLRYRKLFQIFHCLSVGRSVSGMAIIWCDLFCVPSIYGVCIVTPSMVKSLTYIAFKYSLHLFTWCSMFHFDPVRVLSIIATSIRFLSFS